MATLADELLNDFDDSDPEDGDEPKDLGDGEEGWENGGSNGLDEEVARHEADDQDMDDAEEDEDAAGIAIHTADLSGDEDEAKARVEKMRLGGVRDVRSVAGLLKTLQPVLESISHYQSVPPEQRNATTGSIEDNPEYHLLTQSNSLATQIDNEILLVHKFIRDHYSMRFPELETLVTNPLEYAKTVAILQNGPWDHLKSLADSADNRAGVSLRSVLDGPTLMVVTVEATTTRGQALSEAEIEATLQACDMTLQLDRAKKQLTEYVQSRMNLFAPNLTALIGSLTAAQLLNFAGGLKGLAKVPDRNIPGMGSKRQRQSGLATNVGIRQQGFLYHSALIQSIPSDLKIQAMRIVSGKLILAARVDSVHQAPDGSTGEQLREECLRRLDKLTEPPPNRGPRALPAPDDKPSRKRGGRRARKAKEAVAMTDLRKQQNRMAFGKEEREVGYGTGEGTAGLGMIGQQDDGRIRATQIDRRTMAKLSKKNPGWGGGAGTASSLHAGGTSTSLRSFGTALGGQASSLRAHGLRTSGVNAASGTASSIAFTPVQGLELVDPKVQAELKRKREAENAGYFSSGTFTQVNATVSANGNGSFKVPSLPPAKKTNMGPPPALKK